MKKLLLTGCVLIVLSSLLAGCNTTRGFGEDVQSGGRAISRAS
jgi:entericidin B